VIARRLRGWLGRWSRDSSGRRRKGSKGCGYSGQPFWHLDPRADEIQYDDVCIGLAREGRYSNQTRENYSVAEHSVIVSLFSERLAIERGYDDQLTALVAAQGLLHDGSEAFLGDMPRPLKHLRAMRGYVKAEALWQNAVWERFNIVPTAESTLLVDEVDHRVCIDEVEALMIDPEFYRGRMDKRGPLGAEIAGLDWQHAAMAFSQRFAEVLPGWEES
jgi:hypothetical protein